MFMEGHRGINKINDIQLIIGIISTKLIYSNYYLMNISPKIRLFRKIVNPNSGIQFDFIDMNDPQVHILT